MNHVSPIPGGHVLALSGGVGGAKLAAGLAAVLRPERLTIVVNTGDDFEHLGLTICPDIDSVVYALAGLNDATRGWGVVEESWQALAMLGRLGEADWFSLGDRDLAMHIARSHRLRAGETLSAVTERLAKALGVAHGMVPMSDAPVRTEIRTDAGWLDFQTYFVTEKCQPVAREFRFAGTPGAAMSPSFAAALARPDLAAVIICPSNPFLSFDPIFAVDCVRTALDALAVPRVAVSPLIGGAAIKGPLGKLLVELTGTANNAAVVRHYGKLLSHLIIDDGDVEDAPGLRAGGLCVSVVPTLMREDTDRARLASAALAAASVEWE